MMKRSHYPCSSRPLLHMSSSKRFTLSRRQRPCRAASHYPPPLSGWCSHTAAPLPKLVFQTKQGRVLWLARSSTNRWKLGGMDRLLSRGCTDDRTRSCHNGTACCGIIECRCSEDSDSRTGCWFGTSCPRSPSGTPDCFPFEHLPTHRSFLPSGDKRHGLASKLGTVRELTGRHRNRLFAYDRYIQILSEGTEPL